ncbi:ABC1 kinase family protein [Romboutsia sp.]|uniref:ABC1 kinase family protein n=1 Tax=Romboutsia sp. TaxID=1965302 RepID=UPI002BCD3EB6|nr:AarF/UbiB family protein [Romboutsia sp.]HSQ90358.1 AarF/UbiB family protein [Romboutsia sp.]
MKISYKNLKRYREIVYILIKYGFSFIVEKLNIEGVAYRIPITNPSQEIKNMSTAEKIRRAIEELGPTYIKLGQILSTRKDLLDQDIIDELSNLRDNVEEFDTNIAKSIFKNEIGLDIDKVFNNFNNKPIAAASIGQVYEARLESGEEVIVKIQRPNIEETIKSDLEILKSMAIGLKDLNKDIDIDLIQIVEEFKTQLIRELDYNFEAINAIKFKKIFKDSNEVYIPQVYGEYTTKKVLVMEKIIGVKLSDVKKIRELGWDTKVISEIGVRSLFKQIFEHGFFHADPHPGNIFVLGKNTISYVDFGMIGIVDKKSLSLLNEVVIAVIEKNVDKLIYILIEMDAVNTEIDISGLRQDLLYLIHYYYDVPIEKINIGDIMNEVFRFFRKYKVSIPSQLSTLAKTIITLEGTGRELNPRFSVSSIGKEFMKYYYVNKFNPQRIFINSKHTAEEMLLDIKTIPKQMRVILRNIEKNNIKIQIEDVKFTSLEERITDLTTQISLSLVLASIVVGSSLIVASPNINNNIWIRITALAGFFISFIIGLLLVIRIVRSQYKKK